MNSRVLFSGMMLDDFLMFLESDLTPIEPSPDPVKDNASKSESQTEVDK